MSIQVRVRTVLNNDNTIGVKRQGPAEFGELSDDAPETNITDATSVAELAQEIEDASALFMEVIGPKLALLKHLRQNNGNTATLINMSKKTLVFNQDPTTFSITIS